MQLSRHLLYRGCRACQGGPRDQTFVEEREEGDGWSKGCWWFSWATSLSVEDLVFSKLKAKLGG